MAESSARWLDVIALLAPSLLIYLTFVVLFYRRLLTHRTDELALFAMVTITLTGVGIAGSAYVAFHWWLSYPNASGYLFFRVAPFVPSLIATPIGYAIIAVRRARYPRARPHS